MATHPIRYTFMYPPSLFPHLSSVNTRTGQSNGCGGSHGFESPHGSKNPPQLPLGHHLQRDRHPRRRWSVCSAGAHPAAVDGQYCHGFQLCVGRLQFPTTEMVSWALSSAHAHKSCLESNVI